MRLSRDGFNMESYNLGGVWNALGVNVIYGQPYRGQAKTIERAHRTIHGIMRRIGYGYTGNTHQNRPSYMKPQKETLGQEAILDLGRLYTLDEAHFVVQQFLDEYDDHSHRMMQGRSPREVFTEQFDTEAQARFMDELDEGALARLLTRSHGDTRKVHAQGVNYKNNFYWSRFLDPALYEGRNVHVTLDPGEKDDAGDVATLYLWDDKHKFICTANKIQAVHPTEAPKSTFEELAARKAFRNDSADKVYKGEESGGPKSFVIPEPQPEGNITSQILAAERRRGSDPN